MFDNNETYNFSTDPEVNKANTNSEGNKEIQSFDSSAEHITQNTETTENSENTVYSGYNENATYTANATDTAQAVNTEQNNGYQQPIGGQQRSNQQQNNQWQSGVQNPYNGFNGQYSSYQQYGYNGQNVQNQQSGPNNQQMPPPVKKKKSGNSGLVAGLLIAALVVGGAGGFGGSYLAKRLDGSSISGEQTTEGAKPNTPDEDNTATEGGLITAPEYVKPENEVNNDLSGLSNMASINNSEEYTYKQLFEKVNESIVYIKIYVNSGNGELQEYGSGTGVIFTTDGYIVTNHHVIESANRISVTVDDKYSEGAEMEAVLVGSDSATDLAILKISRDQPFTAAALGDSDKLDIGQEVCAIGSPMGLKKTITNGIVSGLNRYTNSKGYVLSSIQTNAAINPGNSGGGLFDMYGNVVGIVNSKLISVSNGTTVTENLGFAITINEAKPIMSDLINYGHVKGRAVLGISAHEVSSYEAQIYGISSTGLFVAKINDGAPAEKSELQVGDVITHVDGTRVETLEDVQDILKTKKPGDTVELTVLRSSTEGSGYFSYTSYKEYTFDLTLTESD